MKPANWKHTPNFSLIPDMRSLPVTQFVPSRKYGLSVNYLQVPFSLGFLIRADILFLSTFKTFYKNNPFTDHPTIT